MNNYTYTADEKAILVAGLTAAQVEGFVMERKISFQAAMRYTQDQNNATKFAIKMSDKGCVTLTGLRPPYGVSYYPTEWEAIFANKTAIEAYIANNRDELNKRGAAEKARKAAEKAAGTSTAP